MTYIKDVNWTLENESHSWKYEEIHEFGIKGVYANDLCVDYVQITRQKLDRYENTECDFTITRDLITVNPREKNSRPRFYIAYRHANNYDSTVTIYYVKI